MHNPLFKFNIREVIPNLFLRQCAQSHDRISENSKCAYQQKMLLLFLACLSF